jgi:ABC-type antimicrobial peptide transport system permease subunit
MRNVNLSILIILSHVGVTVDEFWIELLDLLTPYTQYSELQAITALTLIYTIQSSPLHTH